MKVRRCACFENKHFEYGNKLFLRNTCWRYIVRCFDCRRYPGNNRRNAKRNVNPWKSMRIPELHIIYIAIISLDMGRANTFAWLYRGEWTHFSRNMERKRKHPDKSVKALVPELIKCPCVESEDLKSKLDNKCQRKVG